MYIRTKTYFWGQVFLDDSGMPDPFFFEETIVLNIVLKTFMQKRDI